MSQNKSDLPKRKFGLLTTVAMIAGIVIGSGVFFQTPKVIRAVNGNIFYGAAGYLIVAFGIIFGGLTISQYAQKDDSVGGVITYCEVAWGKTLGYLAGFFQTFFYLPVLTAVISWVAASYTFELFGWPNLLGNRAGDYLDGITTWWPRLWACTLLIMAGLFVLNTYATKLAGKYQSFSLVAKLTAIIVLAIAGLVLGSPTAAISSVASYPGTSGGLFAALGFIAFSYDGWMVAPSIAHEIKEAKKNLKFALIFAPLMVTAVYLAFYFGLVSFVGPQAILDGVEPSLTLANTIFGAFGQKIVIAFVVVSITGTVNGLILGYIRLPYALALRNEIFMSKTFAKIDKKSDTPIASAILTFIVPLVWLFLHFASVDGDIMWGWSFVRGLEIDVLPIILMCFFLATLYIGVICKKGGKEDATIAERFIYPILALIGTGIVIYGASTKELFAPYLWISLVIIILGIVVRPKTLEKLKK